MNLDEALANEALSLHQEPELLRSWLTEVHGEGEQLIQILCIVYKSTSNPDSQLGKMHTIRFAVYTDGRQSAGGIVGSYFD